jgi:short-subunit dehydrogenase
VRVVTIKPGFVDTPMTAEFKKGLLWASPDKIATGIVAACDRGTPIAYLPSFWRLIMIIIRHMPESVFLRLRL